MKNIKKAFENRWLPVLILILVVVGFCAYCKVYCGDFSFLRDWDAPGTIINIVITILLLVGITWPQREEEKYRERIDNFKKTFAALSMDRNRYMDAALKMYKEMYKDWNRDGDEDKKICTDDNAHLLYIEKWMNCQYNSKENGGKKYYELESIVCKKDEKRPEYEETSQKKNTKLPDPMESYAENVKYHMGKGMFNGRTYSFRDFNRLINGEAEKNGHSGIEVTVQEGGYYDFYNTCEYLCFETVYSERIEKGKGKKQKTDLLNRLDSMPQRKAQMDLLDMDNRFAGIGINTILILKNVWDDSMAGPDEEGTEKGPRPEEKKPYFLLHRRSDKVAEGMNNYHVIPAGSYQPVKPKEKNADSKDVEPMVNTVLRELGEELLGFEEFYDLNDPELLDELGRIVTPYYLGMGFEPLNTKMEVLTAIVIDMEDLVDFDNKEATDNGFINRKPLFWKAKEDKGKELYPRFKFDGSLEKIEEKTTGGSKRYVPVYSENELESVLNGRANFEGKVSMVPFTDSMLRQYENDMRSTAAMKQIMSLLQKEDNRKALGIDEEEIKKWNYIKVIVSKTLSAEELANLLDRRGVIKEEQKIHFINLFNEKEKEVTIGSYYLEKGLNLNALVEKLTVDRRTDQ